MPRYSSISLTALLLAVILAMAGPAGVVVDDAYTISLLHLNGSDGSTAFTDESGKVWTPHNSMPIKTDHYKFGVASAFFVGGGAYVDRPDSTDFEPRAGPFTIDFWIYPLEYTGSIRYLACKSNNTTSEGYAIWLQDQKIQVSGVNGAGWNIIRDNSATANTWHHIALSSTAETVYLFLDGVQKGSCSRSNIAPHNSTYLTLGGTYYGYLDEFRFSQGIAR